jgi:hypothetical protein
MQPPEDRSLRTALIPWVMALVALIGLSSVAPDYSRNRKSGTSGEASVSQLADNPQAQGNLASPLVFLAPESLHEAAALSSRFLLIEALRMEPLIHSPEGVAQGRAPPASSLA